MSKKETKNHKKYPSIKCYNNNCKRTFFNKKGLFCHLDKSNKCMTALKQLKFLKQKLSCSISSDIFGNNINNEDNIKSVNAQELYKTKQFTKICITDTVYYQNKLAKILEDANVANYVYQQIIEWAIKAQNAKLILLI